jgi:hypothetical protein
MFSFRRWKSNRNLQAFALVGIATLVLSGCDSQVKVRTNNSAGLKRQSTNIHTRNRRPQPAQQVSMGALPPITSAHTRRPDPLRDDMTNATHAQPFILGAGDGLGHSVFAHYAASSQTRQR